jgi:hypothetical protein
MADLFTIGNTALSLAIGAIATWLVYKQYKLQSPNVMDKRITVLERETGELKDDSEKTLLALESLKLSMGAVKEHLDKLDTDNGKNLGDLRDEITRMETRIDTLFTLVHK